MNKTWLLIVIGLLVLGGISLAGRSISQKVGTAVGTNLAEKAIKAASDGQTNVKLEQDGSVSYGSNSKLPSGFPSNVPTPNNATLSTSYRGTAAGKITYSLVYTSTTTAADAAAAYQTQLTSAGYRITLTGTTTSGTSRYATFEATKDLSHINVGAAGEGAPTTLTIVVSQ